MKRGCPEHPKTEMLALRLGIDHVQVVGHLELLFHFTAKFAIRGDIGRWTDEVIATRCGWKKDPSIFIDALVVEFWLDPSKEHRLIVHDWSEHTDDSVHKTLHAKGLMFADGRAPYCRRAATREGSRKVRDDSRKDPEQLPQPSQSLLNTNTHTDLLENQEEPSEPPKPIPEPDPRKPDRRAPPAAANVLSFPVVGTAAFQPIPVAHEHPGEGVSFGEWFAKYVKVTGVAFNGKVEERSRCLWNEIGFFDHRDVWNDLKALEEQLPWRQRFQRPDNYLRDQSWTEKSAFPRGKLPPRSEHRQRVEVELPSL